MERFGHTRRFVSLSAGCLSLSSLHPSSDATRSPRPSACHAVCSAHTAHHHGLREVLPASKCATSIHPWRPRLTDSGIACETRWQSWRLSSPRGALSTVTSRWRGGESPPRSTRPWTESALGTSWPTRGMDGPAWPRMSDGLRLGQRALVPGGRLTPTCPRLRTPKPPMRRRWGTACWAWDGLGPWPMGCDATPPPDATANIPAPMVVRFWLLPLPPLPFSCPSPASTCLGLLLPTSIHVHGIANDLASASLSPLLHRDTGCGFVAPACPAARLSRSVARLETPVSANQASPVRFATTHIHRTLPDRFCRAPRLFARLLSSRRRTPGSHG